MFIGINDRNTAPPDLTLIMLGLVSSQATITQSR